MNSFPEIEMLVEKLVSAWNAGDGAEYSSAFTFDCDYITFNGQRIQGLKP